MSDRQETWVFSFSYSLFFSLLGLCIYSVEGLTVIGPVHYFPKRNRLFSLLEGHFSYFSKSRRGLPSSRRQDQAILGPLLFGIDETHEKEQATGVCAFPSVCPAAVYDLKRRTVTQLLSPDGDVSSRRETGGFCHYGILGNINRPLWRTHKE